MKRRLVGVTAAVLGTVLIGGVGLQATASAAPRPDHGDIAVVRRTVDASTSPRVPAARLPMFPSTRPTTPWRRSSSHARLCSRAPIRSTRPRDPAKVVVKSKHGWPERLGSRRFAWPMSPVPAAGSATCSAMARQPRSRSPLPSSATAAPTSPVSASTGGNRGRHRQALVGR